MNKKKKNTIKKKKRKKYYKVIVFTKKIITVIEKQVYVNVTSCAEVDNKLYIRKGAYSEYGEGYFAYPLTDISEYIIKPQKGEM